jgi:4-amino-4-deoxy-L-arabinose transferase-like glycosyltransferase
MIGWLIWLSTRAFGDGAIAVRLPTIACGAATAWFVFLTARRLHDERVARLAAALAALVPVLFLHGAEAAPDAPMLMFWSASMWALARALTGDPRWWLAAGAFAGLAMDSKYNAVLLPAGVLLFVATSAEHRAWLRRPWPYLAVLVALAVFAPVLMAGRESLAYQGAGRIGESTGLSWRHPVEFARDHAVEATPFVLAAAVWAIVRARRAAWPERFAVALALPVLATFALVSFARSVRGYWSGPAYVSLVIAAAALPQAAWRRLLWGTAWVLGGAVVALPIALACLLPADRTPWTHVARSVGPGLVLACDYHDAAQLAYHRRAPAWDFAVLRGDRVHRAKWPPIADLRAGSDVTVVWDREHWPREFALVKSRFDRLEFPEEVEVSRVGGRMTFVIVRARGWRPP